ncbi:ankyrin repeat domain-containing protein [Chamaesiphon sp. GL140_3_metabinner_50]|uniref:ankyrin repeat domain-containing protein n=1 Tax=Chamaesiphon sp. GL140_3_metabinner_50 TaxID=2970812 RepID=UPI0025F6377E|nr:ankyrin repeat domain-containing protein [Chamaesiphon sp. GL140_3_metabinner_50]
MKESEELLLYQSIEERDFELFTQLVKGRDLQWLNSVTCGDIFDITSPLEFAIESDNQPAVVKILSMGETPSFLDMAVRVGNINILKLLFDAGSEIEDDHELLSQAASSGNLEIMKLLIQSGVDINSYDLEDEFFVHPLVIAIAHGHIHLYEYLLSLSMKQQEILNVTCLQEAARVGNIKSLQFLLDRSIDINSTHHLLLGNTALIAAVGANQWQMVDYLIGGGADVNLQDFYGQTALMSAVSHSSMTLVKKLLAAGANRGLPDSQVIPPGI